MNKLTRSKSDRKLAGVLGGLAQSLGIDSTILRVIFVILLFPTGLFPMMLAYFVMIFIIPNEGEY
ncbi:PspC domain-containing protein [Bacillaceae bacterium Marseille-Q3522]|nr:PspC domain-containing protein [Bacillaceae bacterium Marseille-Q3522]